MILYIHLLADFAMPGDHENSTEFLDIVFQMFYLENFQNFAKLNIT